ncbi:uncharacterized protein LOC112127052 [Cimex lectularius]|uniref:Uncharacterized protein n=1 Tax=Cimex lectularius TaxID=79782 RepID=A0A8I6SID0_CIMLE|nr:uncharacterized protein LOC112127052 [Cimex lectularius]
MDLLIDYPSERYFILPNESGECTLREGSVVVNNVSEGEVIDHPQMPDVGHLSHDNKLQAVLLMMKKYPIESEMKLSYFVSSIKSLPEELIDTEFDDSFKKMLISLPEELPKFETLQLELVANPTNVPTNLIDLLFWMLVGLRNPRFIKIPEEHMEDLLSCFTDSSLCPDPIFAFKVCSDPPVQLTKSQILKKHFGYIGCNNGDVFSLLYYWKRSGTKRCFNDQLIHALKHSKGDYCWSKSPFGSVYKTVLVIEYYPHPDLMFVGDKPSPQLSLSLRIPSYEAPCFFHIGSADLVEISYVFIYKNTLFREIIVDYSMEVLDFGTNLFFCMIFICILARTIRNLVHL